MINFLGNTDNLNWFAAASKYGLTAQRSQSKAEAQAMIQNAGKSTEQEFVLIQVPITIGEGSEQKTTSHWVGHSGKTITKGKETWIEVVKTSDHDATRDQKNSNWMRRGNKMYVKQSAVKGAVVIKQKTK